MIKIRFVINKLDSGQTCLQEREQATTEIVTLTFCVVVGIPAFSLFVISISLFVIFCLENNVEFATKVAASLFILEHIWGAGAQIWIMSELILASNHRP